MKPTNEQICAALARRSDLTEVGPSEDWGGSTVATFLSAHPALRVTFLAKCFGDGNVLSLLVPNLWKVPPDEEAWSVRAKLAMLGMQALAKPVLSPNGDLHLALDLPLVGEPDLDAHLGRGLAVLQADLASLRSTVRELASASALA